MPGLFAIQFRPQKLQEQCAMAGFKTHITTSSILGVGYGAAAFALYNVPAPTCALAAVMCGVSGMLPDLDSGPGRPLRESLAFAAAVVPMMLMHRLKHLGWAPETMMLAGAGVYLAIRFGVGYLMTHFTVHRGMFHSLPAALIAVELTFLICAHEGEPLGQRLFKGGAVLLGFMSHLVLDEIWSIDFAHARLKSSFGTAMKIWGHRLVPNLITFGGVGLLSFVVWQDPAWTGQANLTTNTPNQVVKRPVNAGWH
jgi:hypothetical protein